MKKIITSLTLISMISSPVLAERQKKIESWEEVKASKGFVLSKELYNMRNCSHIWSYQVGEFLKVNKHIKNPNKIEIGESFKLQSCKAVEKKSYKSAIVKETSKKNTIVKDVAKKIDYKEPKEDHTANHDTTRFEWRVGVMLESEKYKDYTFGVRIRGDVSTYIGYDLRFDYTEDALYLKHRMMLQTAPSKVRGHISYTIGKRLNFSNREEETNSKIEPFNKIGLGLKFMPSKNYILEFDVLSSIDSFKEEDLTYEISGYKRVSKDKWLGVFSELGTIKETLTDEKSKKYILTGLKYSW